MLNCETQIEEPADFTAACTAESIFTRGTGNMTTEDAQLDNYMPMADSMLLSPESTVELPAWFDDAPYVGAVNDQDWTEGWTVGL